jgi:hypothetical protein
MNLDEVFQMGNVIQVRGDEYGWVNTGLDLRRGQPVEIQGSKAINFCNWGDWRFTPDGEDGQIAREGSLGYGVPGIKHAQLIGMINGHIFPIGKLWRGKIPENGTLMVAHNDTKQVGDNDGEFEVRVVTPVTAVQGRRNPQQPGAFQMSFTGPLGITGSAQINLPSWMTSPRPKFTVHKRPAHPSDPAHGMLCTETDIDLVMGIRYRRCVHITM